MLTTLQAGRGLAAIIVVAYHVSATMGEPQYGGTAAFETLTRYGNLGIDFFFVLSGFIILHAHARDVGHPERLRRYAWKRFVRVFPIYWIYTAGFVAVTAVGLASSDLPGSALGWLSALSLVRLSSETPPLFVAWTLFHEVAFYALFAVALWRRDIGFALLATWAAVCLAIVPHINASTMTPWQTYTASYNVDFLLGMGAYLVWRRAGTIQGKMALGAGVAVVVAALAGDYAGFDNPIRHLSYGIGFTGIVSGAAVLERDGLLVAPGFLRLVGDASYSVYLVHAPMVAATLKVLTRFSLPAELTWGVTFVICMTGTLIAYLVIERSVLAALRSRRFVLGGPRPAQAAA